MNRRMFLMVLMVLAGLLPFNATRAQEGKTDAWLSSYDKALEQAKADKKIVIADFAGSDWCPPCKALWSQVLSSSEFIKAHSDKAVLVEVDFPRRKKQPDDEKKRNEELAGQFKIEGFPTVIVLDATGKELGRIVGYGGKAGWEKEFGDILAKAK